MPQQVCDVSKSGVSTSLIANPASYLGFCAQSFLSTSYERLGQATNRPVRISNTLERERASQMPQQVCDVSKSGVSTSLDSESASYLGLCA
jgi:hypothetical protein